MLCVLLQVNTICWNSSGDCILSGSDDQHLNITNAYSKKVTLRFTETDQYFVNTRG